jgi:hypothetical protein
LVIGTFAASNPTALANRQDLTLSSCGFGQPRIVRLDASRELLQRRQSDPEGISRAFDVAAATLDEAAALGYAAAFATRPSDVHAGRYQASGRE